MRVCSWVISAVCSATALVGQPVEPAQPLVPFKQEKLVGFGIAEQALWLVALRALEEAVAPAKTGFVVHVDQFRGRAHAA